MCCASSAGGPSAHSASSRRLSMSRASRSSRSSRYSCKESPRVLASTESVRRVGSETPRIWRATTTASCQPQSQPAGGLNWRSTSPRLPPTMFSTRVQRTPGTAAPRRGISPYCARVRPTRNRSRLRPAIERPAPAGPAERPRSRRARSSAWSSDDQHGRHAARNDRYASAHAVG
jgi:hypothetical protein